MRTSPRPPQARKSFVDACRRVAAGGSAVDKLGIPSARTKSRRVFAVLLYVRA